MSAKPRSILPPLVCTYAAAGPELHAFLDRVHAEARAPTLVVQLDEGGRPIPQSRDDLPHTAKSLDVHDQAYPWPKESILREVACTLDEELRHSQYGTNDAELRSDLNAFVEAAQVAHNFLPGNRIAAKRRSPPVLVTTKEKMLHFFNRPVVLNALSDAMQRHALAAPIPLVALRDLESVSSRVDNQPLEWGSEELPVLAVYRPLTDEMPVPDRLRRPLSAYTCVKRRLPKNFCLVLGRYELLEDHGLGPECVCRFHLHPEGGFDYWQGKLFRGEGEEKTAGPSKDHLSSWSLSPGGVLVLEATFAHVTSDLPHVKGKVELGLEWIAANWQVEELHSLRLARPSVLQAVHRAPFPTMRPGTYVYNAIAEPGPRGTSTSFGPNPAAGFPAAEDVRITLTLYDTGQYDFTEERRFHGARKQTTTAVHLGRRWEVDTELRCLRLTAPTQMALRQRRYTTATSFSDLWVQSVEVPLSRLEEGFAYYPFEGVDFPDARCAPGRVLPHCDVSAGLAVAGPDMPRRPYGGSAYWSRVNPAAEAAHRTQGFRSTWRSSRSPHVTGGTGHATQQGFRSSSKLRLGASNSMPSLRSSFAARELCLTRPSVVAQL